MGHTTKLIDILTKNMEQVRASFEHSQETHIGAGNTFSTSTYGVATVDKKKVYLAKKISNDPNFDVNEELCRNLWFMERFLSSLEGSFETNLPCLPKIHGIVREPNTSSYILTEDFTKGKTKPITQVFERDQLEKYSKGFTINVWDGATKAMGLKSIFDPESFRSFFITEDKLRVGDFGTNMDLIGIQKNYGKYIDQLTLELN